MTGPKTGSRSGSLDREGVLVQPEMERWRFPFASIPSFGPRILNSSGSADPKRIWKRRKKQIPAPLFIPSMSALGYALGHDRRQAPNTTLNFPQPDFWPRITSE